MPNNNNDTRPFFLQHHDYQFIMTLCATVKNRVTLFIEDTHPDDMTADDEILLSELKAMTPDLNHMIWKCNLILSKMENKQRLKAAGVIETK